jgi:hypothetical protein
MSEKKAVIIETDDQTGKKDRDAVTGAKRDSKSRKLVVSRKEWEDFLDYYVEELEKEGKFELAARLCGEEYKPTFGERVKHTAVKLKSATVTVLLAAATPLAIILIWEGIRLIVPKARQLPGFIKYLEEDDVKKLGPGNKVVRLAAGSR